jgi:hypothetical protein
MMATVYVHAGRAREFLDLFFNWSREHRGSIVTQPPEGMPRGEDKEFLMVEDEFLDHLSAQGFPYRRLG